MVAISTDCIKTAFCTEHVKGILKQISDAGFSHVQWMHEWNGIYQYSESEMYQIKNWLNDLSLDVKGVHASDGTLQSHFDDRKMFISPNEANRVAGVELVKNRIDLANILNAGEIVLHLKLFNIIFPQSEYCIFEDTYWIQVYKSLDEIIDYSKTKNINVAIENMEHPFEVYQFEQFDKLFAKYDKADLGFCYDLGHNMIVNSDNPFSFVERYNDRLINIHLNAGLYNVDHVEDYREVLKLDAHNVLQMDELDYDRLARIIAKSPYELPVCFEVSLRDKVEKGLSKTLELGNYLDDLIRNYRSEK
ncbi:sugar phosphate isomerase/epimerase family protein [Clostridiaceae bacterium HSG29]|nr:sugar phosphate isomerase/epimerase family protein [Clostridiaceae bacterium HSG29]